MIPTGRWLGWLIVASILVPRIGHAAVADPAEGCPRRVDVDAALAELLSAKPERRSSPAVTLRDFGTTWAVEVAGRSASYSDPDRNCAERTRVAAVFVALVLEPPDLGETPAAPVAAVAAKPAQSRSIRQQRFEVAPELLVAPGTGRRDWARTWGAALRWLWTFQRLGFSAGLEASYPAVARLRSYELSLARVALDTSPRFSWRLGGAEFGLEAGPYGALLLAHGNGLFANASSTHVDVGGRAAFRVQTTGRMVSPFLAAQVEVSARHFSVVVDPSGDIGTAPRVWLGVLAGASVSLGHRH